MNDDPYYKIMIDNGKLIVVCLQWFDEYDYDPSNFISSYKFPTEEAAYSVVNGLHRFIGNKLMGSL